MLKKITGVLLMAFGGFFAFLGLIGCIPYGEYLDAAMALIVAALGGGIGFMVYRSGAANTEKRRVAKETQNGNTNVVQTTYIKNSIINTAYAQQFNPSAKEQQAPNEAAASPPNTIYLEDKALEHVVYNGNKATASQEKTPSGYQEDG